MKVFEESWLPHDHQHEAYAESADVQKVILVWHRQAGKTQYIMVELIQKLYHFKEEDPEILFLTKTIAHAKKIMWKRVKKYLDRLPNVKYDKQANQIHIYRPKQKDTATITFLGYDDLENIEGYAASYIFADELQWCPLNVLHDSILETLAYTKGYFRGSGVPRDEDDCLSVTLRSWSEMQKVEPETYYTSFMPADRSPLYTPESLEKERKEKEKSQALDGFMRGKMLVPITGYKSSIYKEQLDRMKKQGRYKRLSVDPRYKVHIASDIGTHTVHIMYQVIRGYTYIIDMFRGHNRYPADYCKKLLTYPYNYGILVLPHDSIKRAVERGATVFTAYKKGMGLNAKVRRNIKVGKVEDGIAATREGLDRTFINSEKCSFLMEALKRFKRKTDKVTGKISEQIVKDPKYIHTADACREIFTYRLYKDNDELGKQYDGSARDFHRMMREATKGYR